MRAPRYGELGVVNLPSEVKVIWHTRNEELPELPSWRWAFQHQTDMQQVEDRELVVALLERARLTEREQTVLCIVIMENGTELDAADALGITQSRAWQILHKGLRKLRHPLHWDGLLDPIPEHQRNLQ